MAPMNHAGKESPEGCAGRCELCETLPGAKDVAGSGSLAGGRMVWASAAVFLLPLAGAIAGAVWVRTGPSRQLAAALAGFVAGVAAAAGLIRWSRPRAKVHS